MKERDTAAVIRGKAGADKRKPAIAPRGLSASIYEELRERICLLRYPPGDVLRETELANEFGVSRTPVRQVLQRLEFEGFVETKNGVGTIVTGVDFKQFKDVYELRLRLCEMIGQLSARPCTDTDLSAMKALYERAQKLRSNHDTEEFWRINHERQGIVGSLTTNAALRQVFDLFYYQTSRVWFRLAGEMWEEQVEELCTELTDIIRAMRSGDTQAIAYAERNHLCFYMVLIGRYVSGQRPVPE
ncbi:GntR family transcriptional regulator [Hypericibacter sp.]|uniref:GntR family transcriptional regulator n=1 Tax=Hypericibacter sp. TaxID=2705401 RepID=UPI003D6D9521